MKNNKMISVNLSTKEIITSAVPEELESGFMGG